MSLDETCKLIYGYDIELDEGRVEVKVYATPKFSFVDIQYVGNVSEEIKKTIENSLRKSKATSITRYDKKNIN